jgi:antitoxin HigA-1
MKQFQVIGANGKEIFPPIPTHPGEVLGEELEARSIPKKDFAVKLGVQAPHISEYIKGKRNISAMVALKLEELLGIEAGFWLRMQNDYDLAIARRNIHSIRKLIRNAKTLNKLRIKARKKIA